MAKRRNNQRSGPDKKKKSKLDNINMKLEEDSPTSSQKTEEYVSPQESEEVSAEPLPIDAPGQDDNTGEAHIIINTSIVTETTENEHLQTTKNLDIKNEAVVIKKSADVIKADNPINEIKEPTSIETIEKKIEHSDEEEKPINETKNDEIPIVEIGLTDLDATDSQIFNVDESLEKRSPLEIEKKDLGISSGSDVIRSLINDMESMNRLIVGAKRDLAAIKLKMNQSQRNKSAY